MTEALFQKKCYDKFSIRFGLSHDCNTIIESWNGWEERQRTKLAKIEFSDLKSLQYWSCKTLHKVSIQKACDSLYLQ